MQEVFEKIRKEIFRLNDYSICSLETCNTLDILDEFVEGLQKEYNNGWIPCSERLPEEGQRVLATHEGGLNPKRQVIEHFFQDGRFLNNWEMDTDPKSETFGQRYMGDVIAWQPLPEEYKPKGDEE